MEGSVRLVREDVGIARLVLARPEKRNALTDRMIDSLIRHMESLQWEPSEKLRFLVLEAEGDFFCSGSDVDELKKTGELSGDDNIREAFIFARLFRELSALPFPTIAMVRGGAFGAAAGILASADYVVADETAVFGIPEARLGLVPAVISLYMARKTGLSNLSAMSLRGGTFSAGDALRMGLVHRIAALGAFEKECAAAEDDFLACGPESLRKIKLMHLKISPLPENEIEEFAAMQNAEARASEEGREGMTAFRETRPPKWLAKKNDKGCS